MSWPASLLLLVALIGLPGCGYKVVRYDKGLGGIRSIALPTLRNDSHEPGVEYIVGDALRQEFLRRGGLHLSNDPKAADLVIAGRVLPVETRGRSFSSVVLAVEYEVTLMLELKAERRDGGEVLFDAEVMRESERYLASADVEATRKNRDEALRRVAQVLAGRVHDALYEVLEP